jgi:serine/threonine protein kinase
MLDVGHEIGKYLILDFLGNGQFGYVYHVQDRALSVERALKVLEIANPDKYVELIEAQIQFKCRHQNCIEVNSADVAIINGTPHVCIDMELVSGGSLEKMLAAHFVSARTACKIICDVSYGLEHSHGQGVLHKDIKPGNILLANGVGKLSDFGVSEYVGEGGVGVGMAYTTHQPPEFHNQNVITVQSDVYSLGITLFRCLNNIVDWPAVIGALPDAQATLCNGTLVTDIGWQPWVPKKLQRIVAKACAPSAANRYLTVRDLRQAIDRVKWENNWERTSAWTWNASGKQHHEVRLVGKHQTVFEHLINGRRRHVDTLTLPTIQAAQTHLMEFVASSTVS